jgi:hypothetical protein
MPLYKDQYFTIDPCSAPLCGFQRGEFSDNNNNGQINAGVAAGNQPVLAPTDGQALQGGFFPSGRFVQTSTDMPEGALGPMGFTSGAQVEMVLRRTELLAQFPAHTDIKACTRAARGIAKRAEATCLMAA